MRVTLVVLGALAASAAAAPSPRPVTVFLDRGGDGTTIPRFGGGDRVWAATVACVREHFAPFQVEITDTRPAGKDFMTALVGGKASMLGLNDQTTNGIGPYDGSVLRTATVHVFSQVGTGERDTANLCAVTAHEIGHSLGLDHSYKCGDVMSYFNDECGAQQFLDVDAPCGEESERDCASGDATQNSYRRLAQNVGLRAGATPAEPPIADDADDADDDAPSYSDDETETSAPSTTAPAYDDADDDEGDAAPAVSTTAPGADDAGDDADDPDAYIDAPPGPRRNEAASEAPRGHACGGHR